MTSRTRQPRRTAEQWQALIDQQSRSTLSAPQFCAEQSIGYQSFMSWRKRLSASSEDSNQTSHSKPSFVELTGPVESSHDTTNRTWHIELDLAPGVQLRIAR
jgi:hypothetical protein